ncbi:MAG: hypothetical protein Q8P76_03655 [bacterium]|nr:hypothetical protein [bacterium]
MFARTERKKARLLDLVTTVLELVRDGKRDPDQVSGALQRIKENPNFAEATASVIKEKQTRPGQSVRAMLRAWQTLYRQEFGIELDISKIQPPKRVPGIDWLIVVAKGLTLNQIVQVLRKHMSVWTCTNNLNSITSVRNTGETYAIWVRDRQEADEELKNKSANDLAKEQINGIALEERLLLELKYFLETNKHLDEKNWTLCAGSRYPDGSVPCVDWGPIGRWLGVGWYGPGSASGDLRARAVVSV